MQLNTIGEHAAHEVSSNSQANNLDFSNCLEDILQALVANTAPPSKTSSWAGSSTLSADMNPGANSLGASHHLTCLMNSDNVAKLNSRNVDKSFMPDHGVVSVQHYQGVKLKDRMFIVYCCRHGCNRFLSLVEARRQFVSCHHCYTYYCGRQCRLIAWPDHKKAACPMGRAASCAKAIIRRLVAGETAALASLSNLARSGYIRMGRGCVVLWLADNKVAEQLAENGKIKDNSNLKPAYVNQHSAKNLAMTVAPQSLNAVLEACSKYDPHTTFVLTVSIKVNQQNQQQHKLLQDGAAASRYARTHAVKKCAILPLSALHRNRYQNHMIVPASLLLTTLPPLPTNNSTLYTSNAKSHKPAPRSSVVVHVMREMEAFGVNVRSQYPSVYRQLLQYAGMQPDNSNNNVYKSGLQASVKPIDIQSGGPYLIMLNLPSLESVSDLQHQNDLKDKTGLISQFDALISLWDVDQDAEVTKL